MLYFCQNKQAIIRMKHIATLLLAATLSMVSFSQVEYVNPFIGTDGMGHTFPGACVPFGIIRLSPDTDTIPHNVNGVYQPDVYKYCAGYQYSDTTIVGFSHTHFSGTGHSDLGDLLIMPTTGPLLLNPGTAAHPDGGYRSRFSHDTEVARPGYYEVTLSDYNVRAQLTATQRVGVHRYTFPKGTSPRFILDLRHGIYNYDGKTLWTTPTCGKRYTAHRLPPHQRMGKNQLYLLCHFPVPSTEGVRLPRPSKGDVQRILAKIQRKRQLPRNGRTESGGMVRVQRRYS
jgi:hypothetical protein